MEMECQSILRPKDKIWVGNQIKSVPEGTYDRIYRTYGPYTSQELIVLRKTPKGKKRITKELHDPSIESIYIEHRPFLTSYFTDSVAKELSETNWKSWRKVEYPTSSSIEEVASDFNLSGRKTPKGSDDCRIAKAKDLANTGVTEFNIKNKDGTFLDNCNIKELRCLIINPQRDNVIICYTDKNGEPAYATFSPSQLEDIPWERLRIY